MTEELQAELIKEIISWVISTLESLLQDNNIKANRRVQYYIKDYQINIDIKSRIFGENNYIEIYYGIYTAYNLPHEIGICYRITTDPNEDISNQANTIKVVSKTIPNEHIKELEKDLSKLLIFKKP